MKNEMVKLSIVLFCITAVVALCLGGVNAITEERIAEIQLQIEQDALLTVMPGATFEEITVDAGEGSIVTKAFKATKDGADAGYCMTVTPTGFSGAVTMIVGVDMDGTVTGIDITKHAETPGLGSKADENPFKSAFVGTTSGVSIIKGTASENQISAISSATITSVAVANGVNAAIDFAASMN